MKEMTKEEIIKAIEKHQNAGCVHPLTCGNDSTHKDLVAKEVNGKVILVCDDCDYTQDIPSYVLEFSPYLDDRIKQMSQLFDEAKKDDNTPA